MNLLTTGVLVALISFVLALSLVYFCISMWKNRGQQALVFAATFSYAVFFALLIAHFRGLAEYSASFTEIGTDGDMPVFIGGQQQLSPWSSLETYFYVAPGMLGTIFALLAAFGSSIRSKLQERAILGFASHETLAMGPVQGPRGPMVHTDVR
jgi:hypothetical protein